MTLNNDYILIQRNNRTYKAPLGSLSSIVLLNNMKEDFYNYLSDLSSSLTTLTTTFDIVFYSKSEMNSTFVSKESLSTLNNNGTYVLDADAIRAANTLVSKTTLFERNNDSCWYNETLGKCANTLAGGFQSAKGLMTQGDKIHGDKIGDYHDINGDGAINKWGNTF